MTKHNRLAAVFGCAGLTLTDAEREFYLNHRPVGFILFQRNCDNPHQIKSLIAEFKVLVADEDALILIDQEGGRVQRLKPPHWRQAPSAATFGTLVEAEGPAERAVWLNARLLASELLELGFSVDCAPCLDLRFGDTHAAIGDRSFGRDPIRVARLGRAMANGLLAGGILPVIKHLPGHGRAKVDSHDALPLIEEELNVLKSDDFLPFIELSELPLGMTAHLLYRSIDAACPGTQSRRILNDIIRHEIGFDGLLFSDDLSMNALGGTIGERAARSLAAGCDIALHCNGDIAEMEEIAADIGDLSEIAQNRLKKALSFRVKPDRAVPAALAAELTDILQQYDLLKA